MSANGDITTDASREGEIEVERVTESQRFMVNVFSQRPPEPAPLPRPGSRVTTPH